MTNKYTFGQTGYYSVNSPIIASGDNKFVNLEVKHDFILSSGATSGYILQSNAGGSGSWIENISTVDTMVGVNLDFNGADYQTITITGDVTFTSSNRTIGREASIKLLCDGSGHNLTFPAWIFIGTAAPTSIAANKTAILSATCFGTNDTDVVAAYAVEP